MTVKIAPPAKERPAESVVDRVETNPPRAVVEAAEAVTAAEVAAVVQQPAAPDPTAVESDDTAPITYTPEDYVVAAYEFMLKDIRSWGFWSIGLGVLHLVGHGFFSGTWGVVLILTGLASFYFRQPAMYAIYGTTLAWAGISNLLGSGPGGWTALALMQLFFAFQTFRQFFRYRHGPERYAALPDDWRDDSLLAPARAERTFPWASLALSAISLLGGIAVFTIGILFSTPSESGETHTTALALEAMLNLGVLGFACGVASLLSGFRERFIAVVGTIVGAVPLFLFVAMSLGR